MPRVRNLDEFLHVAYSAGVGDIDDEDDDSFEVVPDRLRWQVVTKASQASSDFLAQLIRESGREAGRTEGELTYEVVGYESEAARLLRGQLDPRNISVEGLAKLFHTAALEPDDFRDLLGQTVAAFASFPTGGPTVLGRTSHLAPDERNRLLGGEKRDPFLAKREADSFVEEVIESWTQLKSAPKKKGDRDH